MIKIDLLDKKILHLLTKDGRMEYTKIAKKIGVSVDKVIYRNKRLTEKGVLEGYKTVIDYSALGYESYTILIKLQHSSRQNRTNSVKFLKNHPFVLWVGVCVGNYDIRINIIAKNTSHMRRLIFEIKEGLNNNISDYHLSDRTKKETSRRFLSFDYLSTKKESAEIRKISSEDKFQISKNPIKFDKKHWQIIDLLCSSPRITFREIGELLNISFEDARYRTKKIFQSGIVKGTSGVIDFTKFGVIWGCIFLDFGNMKEEKEVIDKILHLDQTTNIISYVGKWDIEITFLSKNIEEFDDYLLQIRSLLGRSVFDFDALILRRRDKFPQVAQGVIKENINAFS